MLVSLTFLALFVLYESLKNNESSFSALFLPTDIYLLLFSISIIIFHFNSQINITNKQELAKQELALFSVYALLGSIFFAYIDFCVNFKNIKYFDKFKFLLITFLTLEFIIQLPIYFKNIDYLDYLDYLTAINLLGTLTTAYFLKNIINNISRRLSTTLSIYNEINDEIKTDSININRRKQNMIIVKNKRK